MTKFFVLAAVVAALASGCVKEMADQPKIKSFRGQPAPPPAGALSLEESAALPQWKEKPTLIELERGQQRYDIYCSMCHGRTGEGDGMVVQRGFPKPLSFFDAKELAISREEIRDVIEQGQGRMSAMSEKLSPEDRRNVAMYVKALQFSRVFPPSQLNDHDRDALKKVPR